MSMKVIEWLKSLFKCNKVEETVPTMESCQKMMSEYPASAEEAEMCTNPATDKPVKKSKKRGRPRKKKKEE